LQFFSSLPSGILFGYSSTQVRVGQLKEAGEVTTKQIGEHDDCVHSLAIEPGSPYIFYNCGEDGLVQHVSLRTNYMQICAISSLQLNTFSLITV
jgi:hypothetical protein